MKSYIIGIVGALVIAAAFLAGCTSSRNMDEIQERVLDSVKPSAEKWFETNMSDANNISVELCGFDWKKESCDIVTGYYDKDDSQYRYWLNVVTEEFCSEEYYDILEQYLQEWLADSLGADGTAIEGLKSNGMEFDIPLEDAVIQGKDDYSVRCRWAYRRFAADELETVADQEMSRGDKEIRVVGTAPDEIIAEIEKLAILKEHGNWTFILQEERDALEYRVYYSDGKYHISRAFLDDKGILQYEKSTLP